ncbi:protein FAM167A-like [Ptychodera flava]|uniref:protein FAM167A-like n=1 Tax=Ptychodera flava TaxID=63121 RepID=UPI00396A067E
MEESQQICDVTTNGDDSDEVDDLAILKSMTTRLKLKTRRPSYIEWRAKLEKPSLAYYTPDVATVSPKSHAERKEDIESAIEWLRRELIDMRSQDQSLARQLVQIHREIQRLRLEQSCEAHRDMIDEMQYTLEEQDEMADICEMDPNLLKIMRTPLNHLGVTRMNLSTRRFSLC